MVTEETRAAAAAALRDLVHEFSASDADAPALRALVAECVARTAALRRAPAVTGSR